MTNLKYRGLTASLVLLACACPLDFGIAEAQQIPDATSRMGHSRFYQREQWFYKQRQYPLGSIPENSRFRALQQIRESNLKAGKNMLAAAAQPVPGDTWVSIGPAPIQDGQVAPAQPVSGRVTAIAVDPLDSSHWLLGAAQGGVWETRDSGGAWFPLTDGEASLAMGAIAFAPSSPNIIYAGTGEANFSGDAYAGMGLLKSTNGGATWQLLATNTFAKNTFSEIRVHRTNPNLL